MASDRIVTTITVDASGDGSVVKSLRHTIIHVYLLYTGQGSGCEVALKSKLDDSNSITLMTVTGNTDGIFSPTTPIHDAAGSAQSSRIPISVYGDLEIAVSSGATGSVKVVLEVIG